MGIFLITYEINTLGHNETMLLTSIISDSFTQLSDSSYLIETDENEIEIQEHISNYLNNNAAFQIIPIKKFSYGPMPYWLAKRFLKHTC